MLHRCSPGGNVPIIITLAPLGKKGGKGCLSIIISSEFSIFKQKIHLFNHSNLSDLSDLSDLSALSDKLRFTYLFPVINSRFCHLLPYTTFLKEKALSFMSFKLCSKLSKKNHKS